MVSSVTSSMSASLCGLYHVAIVTSLLYSRQAILDPLKATIACVVVAKLFRHFILLPTFVKS